MKKVYLVLFLLFVTGLAFSMQSATPCTDAWEACVGVNGYPDAGCDAGWDACMEALY